MVTGKKIVSQKWSPEENYISDWKLTDAAIFQCKSSVSFRRESKKQQLWQLFN